MSCEVIKIMHTFGSFSTMMLLTLLMTRICCRAAPFTPMILPICNGVKEVRYQPQLTNWLSWTLLCSNNKLTAKLEPIVLLVLTVTFVFSFEAAVSIVVVCVGGGWNRKCCSKIWNTGKWKDCQIFNNPNTSDIIANVFKICKLVPDRVNWDKNSEHENSILLKANVPSSVHLLNRYPQYSHQ